MNGHLNRSEVVLRDDVITLRAFSPDDVEDVTAALQDPEIQRWTTSIPFPYRTRHFLGWIAKHEQMWIRGESAHFAVVDDSSGKLSGGIGLDAVDWSAGSARVGYWIAPWARRRGFATSALKLMKLWALNDLGLKYLELATLVGNTASEGVALKAGFVITDQVDAAELVGVATDNGLTNRWRAFN